MGGEGGGKGSLGSRGFSPLSHNFCINNYMMEPKCVGFKERAWKSVILFETVNRQINDI